MKLIPTKLTFIASMVASGLALHMGTALASPTAFSSNIAVTSAACTITTLLDTPSPLTATADFSAEQISTNAAPTLNVPAGVRIVTVSSNCPIHNISMVPQASQYTLSGSTVDRSLQVMAAVVTSNGQWPVDFFWSDFKAYKMGSTTPVSDTVVNIGNGDKVNPLHYKVGSQPFVAAGADTEVYAGVTDENGAVVKSRISAPVMAPISEQYHCIIPSFTGMPGCHWTKRGAVNKVTSVSTLSDGTINRLEAYIGAAFGVTPYDNAMKPSATATKDGETVAFTRTLTITTS